MEAIKSHVWTACHDFKVGVGECRSGFDQLKQYMKSRHMTALLMELPLLVRQPFVLDLFEVLNKHVFHLELVFDGSSPMDPVPDLINQPQELKPKRQAPWIMEI